MTYKVFLLPRAAFTLMTQTKNNKKKTLKWIHFPVELQKNPTTNYCSCPTSYHMRVKSLLECGFIFLTKQSAEIRGNKFFYLLALWH